MGILAFWCLFELFGFFVFLSEIFVKTSRIHSDSHSLWILKCFLVFFKLFFVLGLGFWTEQLELAMDSHRLRFCSDFFNVIRGGLRVTWVCYSEILVRSSGSLVRILAGELSFFFSDPTLWNPSLLSLSSSLISRCDRLQRATFGGVLALGLQFHPFNDEDSCESLRTCWKIRTNLLLFWFCVLNSEAELKLSVERFWIGFDSELWFDEDLLRVLGIF